MVLPKRWFVELRKIVVYNGVGVVTTLASIPLMYLLDFLGMPYPVYTVLNYLLGLLIGFPLNFRFAFSDQGEKQGWAMLKYWGTFITLIFLVQGFQYLLIEVGAVPRWLGVGTGMVIYAVAGYLLARFWIFLPVRAPKQLEDACE